jgi:hypothetical protein
MEKISKSEIEKFITGLQCEKDFLCYTSGMRKLCRAKDIGVEAFLECLERTRNPVNFLFLLA